MLHKVFEEKGSQVFNEYQVIYLARVAMSASVRQNTFKAETKNMEGRNYVNGRTHMKKEK